MDAELLDAAIAELRELGLGDPTKARFLLRQAANEGDLDLADAVTHLHQDLGEGGAGLWRAKTSSELLELLERRRAGQGAARTAARLTVRAEAREKARDEELEAARRVGREQFEAELLADIRADLERDERRKRAELAAVTGPIRSRSPGRPQRSL